MHQKLVVVYDSTIISLDTVPGSEAASHHFVLTIPASETSPVIYLTAPSETEVGQTFRQVVIDEVKPDVFVSGERLGI